MISRLPAISTLCLALSFLPIIQGCTNTDPSIGENVKKAVWMKYVHIANVESFQATINNSSKQLHANGSGFWALFGICTLDVQGSALSGFSYDASRFYVDAGTAQYGSATPGSVNVSGVAMSSQSAEVVSAASNSFSLSPTTQYFPKQFYPNLKYCIAVYVKERPVGYKGEAMTLKYDGQPQVAALVQDISQDQPDFREFYNPSASHAFARSCP